MNRGIGWDDLEYLAHFYPVKSGTYQSDSICLQPPAGERRKAHRFSWCCMFVLEAQIYPYGFHIM
jgi:hypothetical protein